MKQKLIELKKWEACTNSFNDMGFYREGSAFREDVIIWYQPEEGWFVEQPLISNLPEFSKTAEILMFKIDLMLLEYKECWIVEEPFIFPENDYEID